MEERTGAEQGALVEELKNVFATIFNSVPEPNDEQAKTRFQDLCLLAMMKLKVASRSLHAKLDDNRKMLEAKKVAIDQLQLSYENILYRKANLHREIKTCKDLLTPNLTDIEDELGRSLGSTTYSSELSSITESTRQIIKEELDNRITCKRKLESLHEQHQALTETLDKKRKFLAEIPLKVAVIKSAAFDLKKQFQSI